jgi:putative ABC transport system permease protein
LFARLLFGSLAARRHRLALAWMAVTLGVTVAVALGALTLEVGDDLARTLRAAGPNFVVQPVGASWSPDLGGVDVRPARAGLALSESAVEGIKRSFWKNNVLEAAPELDLGVAIDGQPGLLVGTWFERDVPLADGPWRTGFARLHPNLGVTGRWPHDGADELALSEELAARLSRHVGESVTVSHAGRSRTFVVTALVSGARADASAWAPLASTQALAGRPGEIDRVWLSALVRPQPRTPAPDARRDPAAYERYMCSAFPENVARTLASDVPGAETLPLAEVVAGEARVVSRLGFLMILLTLLTLGAAVLGVVSTSTAAVLERRAELALLRSLGAARGGLAALLLGETLIVSLLGGTCGWLLGSEVASLIKSHSFTSAGGFHALLLPAAWLVAVGVGVLGTLVPLRLALRLDPATVLRGQA